MKFYRIHHAPESEYEFLSHAATWVWDDLGDGWEEIVIPDLYSAVESVESLRYYIEAMQADDDDVVAIFEGERVYSSQIDGRTYYPAEAENGEIWVLPTRLLRYAKVKEVKG